MVSAGDAHTLSLSMLLLYVTKVPATSSDFHNVNEELAGNLYTTNTKSSLCSLIIDDWKLLLAQKKCIKFFAVLYKM
jgi:hypothetical protein